MGALAVLAASPGATAAGISASCTAGGASGLAATGNRVPVDKVTSLLGAAKGSTLMAAPSLLAASGGATAGGIPVSCAAAGVSALAAAGKVAMVVTSPFGAANGTTLSSASSLLAA